jgi:ACS family tartrate transporter-like MFS transporter
VAVYLTKWFPQRYRARAVGRIHHCRLVFGGAGRPIFTTLMTYAMAARSAGMAVDVHLEGVPAMLLGLLTLRIMTERPADAALARPTTQKQWLESTLTKEREALGGRQAFSLCCA